MENQPEITAEMQALQVLAKVAEMYTNSLDEIAKQCVQIQLQQVVQTLLKAITPAAPQDLPTE